MPLRFETPTAHHAATARLRVDPDVRAGPFRRGLHHQSVDGKPDRPHAALPRAQAQWENLRAQSVAHRDIAFVAPTPGLPDMVFTANAGLAIGDTASSSAASTPRSGGRRSVCFATGSRRRAIRSRPGRRMFPSKAPATRFSITRADSSGADMAGARADEAPEHLQTIFGWRAVALKLVDPRFYHLDTCFCPLSGGWLMYYPAAFDNRVAGSDPRHRAGGEADRGRRERRAFLRLQRCRSGRTRFPERRSDDLRSRLIDAGFTPVVTPLSEFMKAGGAAKCLTLDVTRKAA